MASTVWLIIILSFILLLSGTPRISNAAPTSFRHHAPVLPVQKDAATGQYVAKVSQRTPSVSINLVLDLCGRLVWVDCQKNYVSSTYRPAKCRSAPCSLSDSFYCLNCTGGPRPGCNPDTCMLAMSNPVTNFAIEGEVALDSLTLTTTDGTNPGRPVTVPRIVFTCATTRELEGLARGTVGVAGLGWGPVSLPSQLASALSFSRKFAICLSRSTKVPGVIFFGDKPYNFLQDIPAGSYFTYTPLLKNPLFTRPFYRRLGPKTAEYYIGVTSIQVAGKTVPFNTSLLSFGVDGYGGTRISTVDPYTALESSIFKAVSEAFIRESESAAFNMSRVSGVAPFEVCFSSETVGRSALGAVVPHIDFILQNNVDWLIFGLNSMVDVNDNVVCLAFVNGGSYPSTSIAIGGYQLENILLQFDLADSKLGFTSNLLGACSRFNFTSAP